MNVIQQHYTAVYVRKTAMDGYTLQLQPNSTFALAYIALMSSHLISGQATYYILYTAQLSKGKIFAVREENGYSWVNLCGSMLI